MLPCFRNYKGEFHGMLLPKSRIVFGKNFWLQIYCLSCYHNEDYVSNIWGYKSSTGKGVGYNKGRSFNFNSAWRCKSQEIRGC